MMGEECWMPGEEVEAFIRSDYVDVRRLLLQRGCWEDPPSWYIRWWGKSLRWHYSGPFDVRPPRREDRVPLERYRWLQAATVADLQVDRVQHLIQEVIEVPPASSETNRRVQYRLYCATRELSALDQNDTPPTLKAAIGDFLEALTGEAIKVQGGTPAPVVPPPTEEEALVWRDREIHKCLKELFRCDVREGRTITPTYDENLRRWVAEKNEKVELWKRALGLA